MPLSLTEGRDLLRRHAEPNDPVDAPTNYYALYHPANKSALYVQTDEAHFITGFVGTFQTGIDLFRPLVTIRADTPETAADLMADALTVGRPYLLFANVNQLPLVGGSLEIANERLFSIFALDVARFKPVMNVLVTHNKAPDGSPRTKIESNGLRATAGVNWQSPEFAELWVEADAEVRQRGWGTSVAAACIEVILRGNRRPLYLVEMSNEGSVRLARNLGFIDTGARQAYADVIYRGHPGRQSS